MQEQLKTQASEVMRTRALQQLLSNSKLPMSIAYGLKADFVKNLAARAQLQPQWQDIRARLQEALSASKETDASKASQRERQTQLVAPVKPETFPYTRYGTVEARVDVVTAEIKTGKRRVIEYLLSPVQRAGSESLRER